jgi:hypothetical protein
MSFSQSKALPGAPLRGPTAAIWHLKYFQKAAFDTEVKHKKTTQDMFLSVHFTCIQLVAVEEDLRKNLVNAKYISNSTDLGGTRRLQGADDKLGQTLWQHSKQKKK